MNKRNADSSLDIIKDIGGCARVCVAGGPRTGKSTLAVRASERYDMKCLHGDSLVGSMEWSEVSEEISQWFEHLQGKWIIESVAMARAIRKWLQRNPGDKPFPAAVVLLEAPIQVQSKGQEAMMKGCQTVWESIELELIKRQTKIIKRDV